ncbi:Aste57867_12435 [Aphanomyces stellatus]|uniref:Aste57867_12435 protein n=1 Tax=Aphanomyces stellatus TaxID=120398 RepID=A0A485KVJ2_9STRA|nr:hypothetical protein As57867_012389 [Aphanomyces stellatus]VFT89286.1 Aste57867_12435 [Aphanomyces stellatus]
MAQEAVRLRDWSAASVFGATRPLKPPPRPLPPPTNQEDEHAMTHCIRRPTPPIRRMERSSPRAGRPRASTAAHAAATLLQRAMRLSLLRRRASEAVDQVDAMTAMLREMAARTIQTQVRAWRLGRRRHRIQTWLVTRWSQKQHEKQQNQQTQHQINEKAARRIQQWYDHWRHVRAATWIQRTVRQHLAWRRRRRGSAARLLVHRIYIHLLHTCVHRLQRHMQACRLDQRRREVAARCLARMLRLVVQRQRRWREDACRMLQRVVRGMLGRRAVREIRRRRFQCANCGLVEPGGLYCKGCGRPKGSLRRRRTAVPVDSDTSSTELLLAPVVTTRVSTRLARRHSSQDVVLKTRALVLVESGTQDGTKAARMMEQRLQRSAKYLETKWSR